VDANEELKVLRQELREAQERIAVLDFAAEAARRKTESVGLSAKRLLQCNDLLRDELRLDGLKHCAFVENSLIGVGKAAQDLRDALRH
jgi:hypothetical protein